MKPTYRCYLVLVAVLLRRDVLASLEKTRPQEGITSEYNGRDLAKRQTNFQNNDFGQQIPQEYFDLAQQTDATGNPVPLPQRPQFVQQNAQQQQVLSTGSPSGVLPARPRVTLSPFALEQRRLLEEYRGRAVVEQLTALNRPRARRPPAAQPQPQPFQPTLQQQLNQQGPLQFTTVDGQVGEQEFVVPQQQNFAVPQRQVQFAPQQQDFAAQQLQQQQQDFAAQQQDVAAQQQEFVAAQQQEFAVAQQQGGVTPSAPSSEPFSYAQVQFGPVAADVAAPAPRGRSKGQRSVSRPAAANQVQFVDALSQQSVDRPVTTVDTVPAIEYPVTTAGPAVLGARLLQNVVYIQPNGQMYKPIEDAEPVVQIPRRAVSPFASTTAAAITSTTTASPAEDEQPVVLIPQPPPKKSQGRPRQEGRKPGRARPEITLQQHHEQQNQQHLRQHHRQQSPAASSEVETDNFLTSLLARLQQQQEQEQLQPPEATVATAVRPRGGSGLPRTKGYGSRFESSKYLADRNQLQLLQFPHELKALSTAELKALEEAGSQVAAANAKPVAQKHSSSVRNGRPVTVVPAPQPQPQQIQSEPSTTAARLALGNRPVPTPVELNEQQREFLASQGIRNLYRVDYDQSGNVLPLTYVLALDNRPKRGEQEQDQRQ